jgi:hypothetical protein
VVVDEEEEEIYGNRKTKRGSTSMVNLDILLN